MYKRQVLPYGVRRIHALRTLTTESVAVLMPFKAQELNHTNGIYYGQNAVSVSYTHLDPRPAAGQDSGLCSGRAGDGGIHEQPGTARCERSDAGGDTGAVCSPKPNHLCAQQYGRADHVLSLIHI